MRRTVLVLLIWLAAGAAAADNFDGAHRGVLNCAKLSWTKAPLSNEPISVAIMDGKVSFSRVLYGADRTTKVGQESGNGTISPEGAIELTGGFDGHRDTMKSTYKGKVENGKAILNGAQSVTFKGKTEIRAGTLQLEF